MRAQVEQPLKNYLRTATDLVKKDASAFPAFRKGKRAGASDTDGKMVEAIGRKRDALREKLMRGDV